MLRDRESDVARPDREQRWNVNPHTVQAGLELPVSIQVAVVIQAAPKAAAPESGSYDCYIGLAQPAQMAQ
jgi:hypothetical protein